MSDEEEQYSEEEEEPAEEVEQEAKAVPVLEAEEHKALSKPRRPTIQQEREDEGENLTEAEKAMLAAKKRQDEEEAAKLMDYEEKRRIEREREDEELRLLKEKQERRRLEREEEEREFAERRRQEDERRRIEEEERKARIDSEKRKKEEEKLKRQKMGQTFAGAATGGTAAGPNFVIPERADKGDKFGNIVQAKQEMGMTKDQQEDAKRAYLATLEKGLDLPNLAVNELKDRIKALHHRICKLETDKYDLEKRHERQEYDLKELNERQRLVHRQNISKKGAVDPADANSRHPAKVSIFSKYDRQIDRRNFKERRALYDNKRAYPVFPNVPPPTVILENVIRSFKKEADEDEAYAEEEEAADDEENQEEE